jgi:hypothetical protein
MSRVAAKASAASAAARIDLADNTLAQDLRPAGAVLDHADEFMADDARKSGIAADYLKIRIANPGTQHSDECFAAGNRLWPLLNLETRSIER